jgi:hypothetical protein
MRFPFPMLGGRSLRLRPLPPYVNGGSRQIGESLKDFADLGCS